MQMVFIIYYILLAPFYCDLTLLLQIYDENKEKASQAKDELFSIVPPLQEGAKPIPIQVGAIFPLYFTLLSYLPLGVERV